MEVAHTESHVVCTVTGLAGTGSSRKLIGLSRANGIAGRGLRVTWAASEAEKAKRYRLTPSIKPSCITKTRNR